MTVIEKLQYLPLYLQRNPAGHGLHQLSFLAPVRLLYVPLLQDVICPLHTNPAQHCWQSSTLEAPVPLTN